MTETPEVVSLNILDMAQAGRFAAIRDLFAPQLRAMVPADTLRVAWATQLNRSGPVVSIGTPVSDPPQGGATVVRVAVACEHGDFTVLVTVTGAGQLAGLQLAPAGAAEPPADWQPPPYADPASFAEEEVTLGSGPLAVGGTLSVPHRPRPAPAIVLLAGSGPLDRDETLGRNKAFKDLAWGLASRGVAVLRFDKVTFAHPGAVRDKPEFTVAHEYLPHALAAVELLRRQPGINPGGIFLLGHSLGGTLAPRVAAAEPAVAGLVLMAGGAQPLHWAGVRQLRYLASLDPATAAASEPVIEAMTRQARLIDSPELSPATPAGELPFGVPAPYWLDLRDYQPTAVAASLGKPILVLQGGRDYQVTIADDLKRWELGLANRSDVTVHVYDADNHFFFPGSGSSSPAEYEPVQHVDEAVITDITNWTMTAFAMLPKT